MGRLRICTGGHVLAGDADKDLTCSTDIGARRAALADEDEGDERVVDENGEEEEEEGEEDGEVGGEDEEEEGGRLRE